MLHNGGCGIYDDADYQYIGFLFRIGAYTPLGISIRFDSLHSSEKKRKEFISNCLYQYFLFVRAFPDLALPYLAKPYTEKPYVVISPMACTL